MSSEMNRKQSDREEEMRELLKIITASFRPRGPKEAAMFAATMINATTVYLAASVVGFKREPATELMGMYKGLLQDATEELLAKLPSGLGLNPFELSETNQKLVDEILNGAFDDKELNDG